MTFIHDLTRSSKLTTSDILLLSGYVVICIGIGFWASRRQKDEDFMIAGRRLNLMGFITSVVASYVGGAALVAYCAYVYNFGISAIAVFIGTSAGFLFFIPYAYKLRIVGGKRKFVTLSDWFYHKFNKKIGFLSAIVLMIVYFGMLLNQFIAGSSLLSNISGWSYETSLFLSSSVIMIYLVAGGFQSVIRTDIFQYLVLFFLFIFLGFIVAGNHDIEMAQLYDFTKINPGMTIAFIAFGIFIIFQSAEYWQRVYAAKNIKVIRWGFIGSAILTLITGFAITLIGLTAHFKMPGIEAKDAFPEGLRLIMPAKFIGAGLVMIFAAIMSSADTQVFVLASSISVDWIGKNFRKGLTEKQTTRLTKVFIVLFTVAGFLFAFAFRDLVAVIVFITGIGFTIIPAGIASFHWILSNRATMASLISGMLYVIILVIIASFQQNPVIFFKNNADLAILSIVVSALFLLIFQLMDRKKLREDKTV
jgi:SSS family solute:Na+ symporter